MEERAMNAFVKDISFLTESLSQKSPDEVNAGAVYEYLDLLKNEAQRILKIKYMQMIILFFMSMVVISTLIKWKKHYTKK